MKSARSADSQPRVSLWRLALAFAKVGAIGFGGGVGMLALIRQTVVERKRWVDDEQLGVAVAMGQMLPGPFVSNYAEYIGYELRGIRGMIVAVASLLAPCFVLMCVLSFLYFRYGSVPVVGRLFSGVQPVVVGILAWATWYIGKAHVRNWRAGVIAALAFAALMLKVDVLFVVLGAGLWGIVLSGALGRIKPKGKSQKPRGKMAVVAPYLLLTAAQAAAMLPALWRRAGELALVFLKVGALIFGGGFASIPFLQHEVVQARHWLTAREFIDGVALGQMTPGPVAITATFIGYKVMGLAGALVATLAVFLPSFFMLWGLIHVYRRLKDNPLVTGFLSGVLPAVTGMLLSATVFIGRTALTGPAAAVVALLSLTLLLRFRLDPIWLVLGGALLGLLLP